MKLSRISVFLLAGGGPLWAFGCSVPDLPVVGIGVADGAVGDADAGSAFKTDGDAATPTAMVESGSAADAAMDRPTAPANDAAGTRDVAGDATAADSEAVNATPDASVDATLEAGLDGAPDATREAGPDGGTCANLCTVGQSQCGSSGREQCQAAVGTCPNWVPVACPTGTTCQGGACVCPGANPDACGSVCTNKASDANNCGACGHSCSGGLCTSNACQPVTLASGQSTRIGGLAINSTGIYWIYQSATMPIVRTCAIEGCGNSPTTMSNLIWAQGIDPIVVDDSNIYINTLDYNGVVACSVSGCTTTTIISSQISNQGIARDPVVGNVYWFDGAGQGVQKRSAAGIQTVYSSTSGAGPSPPIASDGTYVYFVVAQSIMRCPAATSAACDSLTPLSSDGGAGTPGRIAADGTNVYWALGGTIYECPVGGCTNPTVLAAGRTGDLTLAVDGTKVYWTEPSAVMACAKTGCAGIPSTAAAGLGNPTYLAVDGSNLYWFDVGASSIMKLAKP